MQQAESLEKKNESGDDGKRCPQHDLSHTANVCAAIALEAWPVQRSKRQICFWGENAAVFGIEPLLTSPADAVTRKVRDGLDCHGVVRRAYHAFRRVPSCSFARFSRVR